MNSNISNISNINSNIENLGLYIHIPWCVKKCPYCDFNSHSIKNNIVNGIASDMKNNLPEAEYISALQLDLQLELERIKGRTITSIFIGGGTPSLFSPAGIGKILSFCGKYLNLANNLEITMEVNPGTVEHYPLADYLAAGINRFSIGAQSFNDQLLQTIGRIHNSQQILAVVDELQQANCSNFNLDIMYGLPGQTYKQAIADLQQAVALRPNHLSWYHLTIEPNTVFYTTQPVCPDDILTEQIQSAGNQLLQQVGFTQYEVSAFAKLGYQCQHNLNYWHFGDYLGIGAGAHSKLGQVRSWKFKQPKTYLDGVVTNKFLAGSNNLANTDIIFEYLLNRLRLIKPVLLTELFAATGIKEEVILPELDKAKAKGLITVQQGRLEVTALGRRFLDELLQMFLPSPHESAAKLQETHNNEAVEA